MGIKVFKGAPTIMNIEENLPTNLSVEIKPGVRANLFEIIILHPNKMKKDGYLSLFDTEIEAKTLQEAKLASEIIAKEKFSKVETKVKVVTVEKNKLFKLEIHYKKRLKEGERATLYRKTHKVTGIEAALAMAHDIKNTFFDKVETVYEDVKFIPSYKQNKMKLKLKKDKKKV
jgi:hypothetical protein